METLKSIRSRIEAAAKGKAPAQRRYPKSVRDDAVAYAQRRIKTGSKVAPIARRLGIPDQTLRIWIDSAPTGSTAIRPVALVPRTAPAKRPERVAVRAQPVLVTPQGFRIEGLALDELVKLLRALA